MKNRATFAIIRSTALEILSEPLTLLVLLTALALTILAPVFHYHQFGEPTRMARDAGLSALFTCGGALAVFTTIRAFRREIESGTLEMALAHPVSRGGFFLSKIAGAFLALLVTSGIIFGTTVTIVNGAAVGGRIADETGQLATVWGPCVAAGVATMVAPLALGAVLNRFGRFRFVLTALVTALALALGAMVFFCCREGFGLLSHLAPVAVLLVILATVFLSAAGAFAVRFAANAAASLTGLVLAAMMPFVGNYYLADALSKGGRVPWSYVGGAALASLPAIAAFLALGVFLSRGRD